MNGSEQKEALFQEVLDVTYGSAGFASYAEDTLRKLWEMAFIQGEIAGMEACKERIRK
jgi:hypothetical protein